MITICMEFMHGHLQRPVCNTLKLSVMQSPIEVEAEVELAAAEG
jgi:hypothetical protein